ncbi:MAG: hypothetical protein R3321_00230 [Nitrososphaeraceae archaeon]|nr:hypothetical protein [Nitrososphaeraceae archaeon]
MSLTTIIRQDGDYGITYTIPEPYYILDGDYCYYPSDIKFGEIYEGYIYCFSSNEDMSLTVCIPLFNMDTYDKHLIAEAILSYLDEQGLIKDYSGLFVQTPLKSLRFSINNNEDNNSCTINVIEEDGNIFTL